MTENLAGRGDGLAGRILAMDAKLHDAQGCGDMTARPSSVPVGEPRK